MAQPAYAPRTSHAAPIAHPRSMRARLVVDHSRPHNRALAEQAQERSLRTVFHYLIALVCFGVVLGLGSVFINAEATRCSQQSSYLRSEISQQTALAQDLELQRAKLRNATRIEQIARKELNMVPVGNNVTALEIGTEQPARAATATAAKPHAATGPRTASSSDSALHRLARMTAGEASALLVGDISLVSSR